MTDDVSAAPLQFEQVTAAALEARRVSSHQSSISNQASGRCSSIERAPVQGLLQRYAAAVGAASEGACVLAGNLKVVPAAAAVNPEAPPSSVISHQAAVNPDAPPSPSELEPEASGALQALRSWACV